jgi:hypothetical protein
VLTVLTLLALVGAGVSRLAATNGDIHVGDNVAPIGGQLAAINGTIHIGGSVAPIGGQTAATNGDIHVGS